MIKWFCNKCDALKLTEKSNEKSAYFKNGIITNIDGVLCAACTEKEKHPVLMLPLPDKKGTL